MALQHRGLDSGMPLLTFGPQTGYTSRVVDASFFRLPRELRDRVYREMLTPKSVRRFGFDSQRLDNHHNSQYTYGLTPALLRVNRQIHQEAADVLYNQNCWVGLTAYYQKEKDSKIAAMDAGAPWIVLHDSFNPANERLFNGVPSISIVIRAEDGKAHANLRRVLLVSADDLPSILDQTMPWGYTKSMSIGIKFKNSARKYPWHTDRLLHCLRGIHGIRHASIHGFPSETFADSTMSIMMSPRRPIHVLLQHVESFQVRGDHEAAKGHINEAAMIYMDGYCYTRWADNFTSRLRYPAFSKSLSDEDKFLEARIHATIYGLWASHAMCEIISGICTGGADYNMAIVQQLGLRDIQQAANAHINGLLLIAEQKLDTAISCFNAAVSRYP